MKTFKSFNTNRMYSDKGQLIIYSCERLKDFAGFKQFKIVFIDIARNINHVIDGAYDTDNNDVLNAYDKSAYPNSLNYADKNDIIELEQKFKNDILEFNENYYFTN